MTVLPALGNLAKMLFGIILLSWGTLLLVLGGKLVVVRGLETVALVWGT